MIRVGLIGFGLAGRVFHAPVLSSVEGLELASVLERTSNNAAERYPGITVCRSLEAMLADTSHGLFVVATPNGTHYALAKEILGAGKNVVVDKPMVHYRLLLGSRSISGTQNRNFAPLPGVLVPSIPPPCAFRMARVMARPMPDPLCRFAPRLPR
jgi:hypothetical protein